MSQPRNSAFNSTKLGVYLLVLFSLTIACKAQQPANPDPYVQLLRNAGTQAAQGNLSSAVGQIQAAIALQPNEADGWYRLGSILGQTGDFPGAAAALRHALTLDPGMARAHYSLALTLIGNPQTTEDWPGAVAECQAALKLQPAYPEALNLMGVGFNKLGQYPDAVAALEQAIRQKPKFAQAHFNLGLAFEGTDRLSDAAREYRVAIALDPAYAEAESALGKLLLRMGKRPEAMAAVLRALHANPDLTDAHYTLARILQAVHRKPEAALEFAIARELTERPANGIQSSQMSNQALTLASKGDMAEATSLLQKAIALKPDYGVPHFNLGLILADQAHLAASVQELSKAVSLLPAQAAPWFELGRVLQLTGDTAGALHAVAWAAHLAPENAAMQTEWKRLQTAGPPETVLQPAVGARSDTAAAHSEFAEELGGQGDFEGAVGEWLRALALQPAKQDARRELASAYGKLGDRDRAAMENRKLRTAFATGAGAHSGVVQRH